MSNFSSPMPLGKNFPNAILVLHENSFILIAKNKYDLLDRFPQEVKMVFLETESYYYSTSMKCVINFCVKYQVDVKDQVTLAL